MALNRLKGKFSNGKTEVTLNIPIFCYKENDVFVVYSPALDIFGYGNTEQESHTSFKVTLDEFLRYTTNKNTLLIELKKLGWKVEKKKKETNISAPDLEELLRDNEQFSDIFHNKNYKKADQQVPVLV